MSFPFLIQYKTLERALGDIFRGNDTQAKQRHARAWWSEFLWSTQAAQSYSLQASLKTEDSVVEPQLTYLGLSAEHILTPI